MAMCRHNVCMRTSTKTTSTTMPKITKRARSMLRSNYFLPVSMKDGLNALAERRGTTAADLVRKAVGTLLKRNKIEY